MGPTVVVGRERERALTSTWVQTLVRGEPSGTLVVRGPAGIGKFTIWLDAVNPAESAGVVVVRTQPSEADISLG